MSKEADLPLELGAAVARAACQLWAGPTVAATSLTLSVAEIFTRKTSDAIQRKRGERAFDRIGDELAERMARFIELEYGGLPEHERLAAIATAAQLFQTIPMDARQVLDADLSPLPIERNLRAKGAAVLSAAALSEAGEAFFDRLLTDCCNYVIEIIVTLPEFSSAATAELLQRETEIIRLIQEMLDRLPPSGARGGEDLNGAAFESEYRRQLLRQLDWLELFGVDLSSASRRYALSVAYVSLDVGSEGFLDAKNDGSDEEDPPESVADRNEALAPQGVERALSRRRRTLLRGEAGSGKTTLLRWLAVRAARADFSGELTTWNGRLPFLVELRRYVGKDLPSPEDFVATVARPMLAHKPQSWVTDRLATGDCIVLVDGLDELPSAEREGARSWLRALVESFPEVTFVVTSRPAAVSGDWLEDADFVDVELQPMTTDDIEAFIERWHAAVGGGLGVAEREELAGFERSLKALVRRTPSVRSLATTPLLCAMLCGLNRDRRKQLPQDRLGLYRVALESLLERRDAERGVFADAVPTFGLDEKLLLLQDLAHWLLINGLTSADKPQVLARFEAKLGNMPRVTARPEAVLRHMLVRSGVLREPIEGRVDFIHRTFLEYLAAAEAIQQDSIGMLVANAHVDQWREVVVLAAGRASTLQRERLITQLLERAHGDAAIRHVVQLLAVACLEASPELSQDLQGRLGRVLRNLLPPGNVSDAKTLSSAGNLAVPLLRWSESWYVHEAVASARCLALIGTDEALDALATYMRDPRVMVRRELVRSWTSFDAAIYARRVLSENLLDRGRLVVKSPTLVPHVSALKRLRSLELVLLEKEADFGSLRSVPISRVDLRGNTALRDLEWITEIDRLVHLDVERCRNLLDASVVSRAKNLQLLDLSQTTSLRQLPDLAGLAAMRFLYLNGVNSIPNISFVERMPSLQFLMLAHNPTLTSIDGLAAASRLNSLSLSDSRSVHSFAPLRGHAELVSLELAQTQFSTLADLQGCSALVSLDLSSTGVVSLDGLQELRALRSLKVPGCESLEDASPLAALSELVRLDIRGTGLRDLTPLTGRDVLTVYSSVPPQDLRLPLPVPRRWRFVVFAPPGDRAELLFD